MRILILLLWLPFKGFAQELFSFTEPASNMPAKSIGLRLNNRLMEEANSSSYYLNPEIMYGLSRAIMMHADVYFSNDNPIGSARKLNYNGAGYYIKYRLYSEDEINSHLRVAAFARLAKSNLDVHHEAIDLFGFNSGYEAGAVITKLIKKVALSGSTSFIHAFNNDEYKFVSDNRDALGFTLSAGKLMLPKEYTDYKQTNLNIMLEVLGQYNMGSRNTYIDLAPSVQLIFFSTMRVDFGYRFSILNDLKRNAESSYLLRLEYNIFNVHK